MAIAMSFRDYLDRRHIHYDVLAHDYATTALQTASTAQVPMTQLVKAVIFRDENDDYLMAVLPSLCQAEVDELNEATDRHLHLADEHELPKLFSDCDLGAIPPAGEAYKIPMIWDESLDREKDIYIEAGDHQHLLHLSHSDFMKLMGNSPSARFGRPVASVYIP